MSFDDMLATIADLKEKVTPPQYVLCGTERYKALMKESGLDPDTPEGEHTLNEARKKAVYTGRDSNLVPATSYFGLRVVVSDLVPPDFIQVLPDPVFVLRLSGLEQGGHLPPVAGKEGEEAP